MDANSNCDRLRRAAQKRMTGGARCATLALRELHGGGCICARYTVFTEEEQIEMRAIIDEIGRRFGEGAVSKGEIRPTNKAPVLADVGGGIAPAPVSWGFPKWSGKGVVINARSESALQKPMFKGPLLARRCVVLSTGFFEWSAGSALQQQTSLFAVEPRAREKKVKLQFNRPGEQMLYMAGMIGVFQGENGAKKEAFVLLTTAANDSMQRFHDRMPVILGAEEREDWINSEAFMHELLQRQSAALVWKIAG